MQDRRLTIRCVLLHYYYPVNSAASETLPIGKLLSKTNEPIQLLIVIPWHATSQGPYITG